MNCMISLGSLPSPISTPPSSRSPSRRFAAPAQPRPTRSYVRTIASPLRHPARQPRTTAPSDRCDTAVSVTVSARQSFAVKKRSVNGCGRTPSRQCGKLEVHTVFDKLILKEHRKSQPRDASSPPEVAPPAKSLKTLQITIMARLLACALAAQGALAFNIGVQTPRSVGVISHSTSFLSDSAVE